mmetsp:Transcript_54105/g.61921  ORF Transcript_54105/g.61921 Transcript_54105/m.61921 type:complete len:743 (+) Transcript_54105:40-2268(+)
MEESSSEESLNYDRVDSVLSKTFQQFVQQGNQVEFTTETISGNFEKVRGFQLQNMEGTLTNSAGSVTTFTLPRSISNVVTSAEQKVGIQYIVKSYNEKLISGNNTHLLEDEKLVGIGSDTVSLELLDVQTNKIISVSQLAEEIVLEIPRIEFEQISVSPSRLLDGANVVEVVRCVYWDEESEQWSTEGCEDHVDPQGRFFCLCSHLTEFSAAKFEKTVAESNLKTLVKVNTLTEIDVENGIGLYVSVTLLIMFLLSWGYAAARDRESELKLINMASKYERLGEHLPGDDPQHIAAEITALKVKKQRKRSNLLQRFEKADISEEKTSQPGVQRIDGGDHENDRLEEGERDDTEQSLKEISEEEANCHVENSVEIELTFTHVGQEIGDEERHQVMVPGEEKNVTFDSLGDEESQEVGSAEDQDSQNGGGNKTSQNHSRLSFSNSTTLKPEELRAKNRKQAKRIQYIAERVALFHRKEYLLNLKQVDKQKWKQLEHPKKTKINHKSQNPTPKPETTLTGNSPVKSENSVLQKSPSKENEGTKKFNCKLFWKSQHPVLSIIYVHSLTESRAARVIIYYSILIGQLMVVGSFYRFDGDQEGEESEEKKSFVDVVLGLVIADVYVAVLSALLMKPVRIILRKLHREKELPVDAPVGEQLKVLRRNKTRIRGAICVVVLWWLFCTYANTIYSITFGSNLAYRWIIISIFGIIYDLTLQTLIEVALMALAVKMGLSKHCSKIVICTAKKL